jgi:hypothetical protein
LIHPALKVSAAGVAIAVALEPPLTVSGITAAGWLHGQLSYWPVFGSFMLFLANFLIIELAAGLLFVAAGFRSHRDHNDTAIGRTVVIQLLMLFATGLFLTQQLRDLVRERIGLAKATQVLQRSLLSIPGAELDSVKAELHGQRLEVVAVVGSRSEIAPEMVAEMEALIGQAIEDKPGQGEIRLVVRTVSSTWASSSGLLFEPPNVPPSPEQVQAQQLETALRGVLSLYPGVELGSYRLLPSPEKELSGGTAADVLRLELTLRSPYVFTPRMVLELQKRLDESLSKLSEVPWQETQLLVRTLKVFSATAGNLVTIDAPGSTLTQEQNDLKSLLVDSAAQFRGQELILVSVRPLSDLEVSLPEPGAPAFRYSASIQLRGDRLLTPAMVESWRDSLVRDFQTQYGKTLLLDLEVESELGRRLHVPASAPP